jgi:cytochrome c-type biogenesis protein CcmH
MKYIYLCLMLFLCVQPVLAEDGLTESQKALQADIEHNLVAPCCWNMTVDQHESPKASEIRQKITELLKEGKTKEEILDYFVAQPSYGERILATPSQKNVLGKLAYWLIPFALILGAFIVYRTIRGLSPKKSGQQSQAQKPAGDVSVDDAATQESHWEKRVEDELNKFE